MAMERAAARCRGGGAVTGDPTTAASIQPGDRTLLIVDNDTTSRASCSTWLTSTASRASDRQLGRGRGGTGPGVPAERHHARHPAARHRRLAGARATSRPTSSTRHIPVHIISTDEQARARYALGACRAGKPIETREQLDAAIDALRACVDGPLRGSLLVERTGRRPARGPAAAHRMRTSPRDPGSEARAMLGQRAYDCVVAAVGCPTAPALECARGDPREPSARSPSSSTPPRARIATMSGLERAPTGVGA